MPSMRDLLLPSLVAVVLLLAPGGARAADVFINGENVTGLRNVNLANARVRIDERGNIHIDAPGYTVRRVDIAAASGQAAGPGAGAPGLGAQPQGPVAQTGRPGGPGAPVNAPLTRKFYLVTNQTEPGMTQFDLEIFVNGTSIARARSDADPVIDQINRFLRPGRNEVRIVAHKNLGDAGRRSQSRTAVHRVLIGEGNETGGQVSIDTTLVDYSVNASQVEDQTAVFTITAR